MTWSFHNARKTFPTIANEWDGLNKKRSDHVLLDSDFVSTLLRYFADDRVLLGLRTDGGNPAMVLLKAKAAGIWETFQPSQAPLGPILFNEPDQTGEELLEFTRRLPGYALQFSVLQQDPDHSFFPLEDTKPGIQVSEYIRTARITLNTTFDQYWKSRGSNLRHNLARRRRRLGEKGHTLELRAIRAPEHVADAIREYGRLETKGWKSREGTAVTGENVQGQFYRELLEKFCERRQAVIYQLLIAGKVAASDLCLIRNGMLVILKTAYDEELNDFSPGLLLKEEEIKEFCANKQVQLVEFYGRLMEWHTRWTDEIRPLYHLTCYRHSWVERLRKFAKRFA